MMTKLSFVLWLNTVTAKEINFKVFSQYFSQNSVDFWYWGTSRSGIEFP